MGIGGALIGELHDRAFAKQRLLDPWGAVREAALADGEAGPEVEQFEAAAAQKVGELAKSLADGTFQPSPVVRLEIAKPGGGALARSVRFASVAPSVIADDFPAAAGNPRDSGVNHPAQENLPG